MMNNPMDIWHFLRPILLELNGEDTEMYATVFHALELEEEFQKKKAGAE
jgi:hypothetical protein